MNKSSSTKKIIHKLRGKKEKKNIRARRGRAPPAEEGRRSAEWERGGGDEKVRNIQRGGGEDKYRGGEDKDFGSLPLVFLSLSLPRAFSSHLFFNL